MRQVPGLLLVNVPCPRRRIFLFGELEESVLRHEADELPERRVSDEFLHLPPLTGKMWLLWTEERADNNGLVTREGESEGM